MDESPIRVRRFREILLWPVQLMPLKAGAQIQNHWEWLGGPDCPWQEVADEFTQDPGQFSERHYSEFVSFLPYVQRFLYGEGESRDQQPGYGGSPIRVFRRRDVAALTVTLRRGQAPLRFGIAHVDLHFFHDVDVAILVVELFGEDLPLDRVQDTLFRLGRTYPPAWEPDGSAAQCPHRVEWIGADGAVLAVSDYERKADYLSFVCRHRAPRIAAHWSFLLRPLVHHHSEEIGLLRYRQLEYQRMPAMAYLSLDDPERLERADWVRLGFATSPGLGPKPGEVMPFAPAFLEGFEQRYCYDRYWDPRAPGAWTRSRILCCGHSLVMVGPEGDPFFTDAETGLLGQFRHQYFLLGLVVHFHRAALVMLSDRLVLAVSQLDIGTVESVKRFKRDIRQVFEIFLRFTHRYWFHELSIQGPLSDLFRLWAGHLGTDRLYAEVRDEVQDMSDYLDSDGLRRQANTVLRLTVVTVVSTIGTLVTGFLGMNLLAMAEDPLPERILFFLFVLLATVGLIAFSVMRSKRLADFLEALSDERLPGRSKLALLTKVWERPSRHAGPPV
ncbi:CorA family divalent cation transporter [Azospirillum tabaci]|uniref:CorA family divalent cation transporter n=1 Tax=Azospirillum tabaci TaxID=2752310 RepID=UPI001660E1F5|nr:CorA family divalent cation transporter [Azospirillum tabaci]